MGCGMQRVASSKLQCRLIREYTWGSSLKVSGEEESKKNWNFAKLTRLEIATASDKKNETPRFFIISPQLLTLLLATSDTSVVVIIQDKSSYIARFIYLLKFRELRREARKMKDQFRS